MKVPRVRHFASSTGVTITNPLVLYRALLATNRIEPDPAQHRLALHLQKLYERLKDYEPIVQYGYRLQQISRALGSTPGKPLGTTEADAEREATEKPGVLTSWRSRGVDKEAMALTRVLTSHEEALRLDSPKGLMLHGEVGTGKSMLIDLFADCLPNRKKRRWHFNTFMLETLAKLERLRRSRQMIIPSSLGRQDDYSLLWLARDLISTSPIIFLDEFQLPDRAASKIMTNLMTSFFQLGGVLIATSNRMPEELAKAAGVEFTPPPSQTNTIASRLGFGRPAESRSSKLFSGRTEFAAFLDVLKARCEVWEMENGRDYRRREMEAAQSQENPTAGFGGLEAMSTGNVGLGWEQSTATADAIAETGSDIAAKIPANYLLTPDFSDQEASAMYQAALERAQVMALGQSGAVEWEPATMQVYGRSVSVPRQASGVTKWTFNELCGHPHGPADYITLASTFHTLILTEVPVLTLLQKNEARRLITLLDALYEARCKLVITAQAGPDDIFFPETKSSGKPGEETVSEDPVYSETIAEVYQDATAPFRPNVSLYDETNEPDYTHARLAGMFSPERPPPDALEDGPPNMLRRGDSIFGRDTGDPGPELNPQTGRRGPDFSQGGIFTGEDEKFAFKRARSRLWEMCGSRWWARGEEDASAESTSQEAPSWWKPLDASIRVWERPRGLDVPFGAASPHEETLPLATEDVSREKTQPLGAGEGMTGSRSIDREQDEVLFRHGGSPFRTHTEPPPKLSWTHVWGMMRWGKKAGAWGQGVEGLEERNRQKEMQKKREDELKEWKREH